MSPHRFTFRRALDELRRPGLTRVARIANILDAVLPPRAAEFLFPAAHERAARVVAATYNVHKCVGTDGKFDPGRIVDVIAEIDADVITLQEADRRTGIRNGLLDLDRLQRDCGLTLIPVAIRPASHGWHGNVILVRNGAATRVRRVALPQAEPRGAVMAEVDLPAGRLRVIGPISGS